MIEDRSAERNSIAPPLSVLSMARQEPPVSGAPPSRVTPRREVGYCASLPVQCDRGRSISTGVAPLATIDRPASMRSATHPTMLPIRILRLCAAAYLHLSPDDAASRKIR